MELLRERHERLHRRVEAADRPARSGCHAGRLGIGHRLEEGAAGVLRVRDEALQRGVADPTSRAVRDAEERGRVLWVHEHAQVCGRVANLRALVEARPADHLVRHVLPHEHVFQHTRLRVHPVEDRDLARRVTVPDERRDLGGDETCLRVLVLDLDRPHRVALAEVGEESLRLALGVLLDELVGGAKNRVRRAVVLLEGDDLRAREVLLELEDVANVRRSEAVDRLVLIADRAHVSVLAAKQLQEAVLRVVRVLVLVDEDVAERLPPALERLGEALEDLHSEHEHVVEVDGVRGVKAALVQLIRLGDRLIPEGRDSRRVLLGRDELVLRAGDLRMDPTRRKALRVLSELLEACLHEPHLVLVVVDREAGRVAKALRLAPQHPAARGVEGEDPDRARRLAEHALEPLAHLSGRLVRERDREDLVRLHPTRADEMSDAIREDARLPRARAGDDEERPLGRENGLPLGFVQVREVALGCCDAHRPMLAVATASPGSVSSERH